MIKFFVDVITDPLLVVAIVTILTVFFYAVTWINRKSGFESQFVAIAPTTLTSIGIFFTFLGISIALFNYNVDGDAQFSAQSLVKGARLAFVSSVLGLFFTVFFRVLVAVVRGHKSKADDSPVEPSIRDLYEQLKVISENTKSVNSAIIGDGAEIPLSIQLQNLNNSTVSVREALVGEGDASLSTQFSKLRNDFRDYADNVRKDGTQELVKALEEVIKDFNLKISEQFGDNFKQLNEAVAALLVWQDEHKEHVETLTKAFTDAQRGIENIEKTVAKIPDKMNAIQTVFDATDKRIEQLHAGIESLDEIREAAKNVVPEIRISIETIAEVIKQSIDSQAKALDKQIENVNELQTSHSQLIQDLTTKVSGEIETSAKAIQTTTESTVIDAQRSIDGLYKSLQERTNEQNEIVKRQLETVEENSNSSIEAVKKLANDLSQSIKSAVSDIQDSTRAAISEVQQHIKTIYGSITENTDEHIKSIRVQVQQLHDAQSNSSKDIQHLTATFSETVTTALERSNTVLQEQHSELAKVVEQLKTGSVALQSASSEISSKVEQVVEDFRNQHDKLAKELRVLIQQSIDDYSKAISKNFETMDGGFQQVIERTLNNAGDNLVSITEHFVDSYTKALKKMQQINEVIDSESSDERPF